MTGSADLRFGPGRLAGEPLEGLVARATFSGSKVSIENIDAKLAAGHIVASGDYDMSTKVFDLKGRATGVQLSRLFSLTGQQGATVAGTANFNAQISGNLSESDFSGYQITFDGEGNNVVINGREAGTLALKGRTENKQLNVTLTTGLLGAAAINRGPGESRQRKTGRQWRDNAEECRSHVATENGVARFTRKVVRIGHRHPEV